MPADIDDSEVITQRVTTRRPNVDAPRPSDEGQVSVFRGAISIEDAQSIVTRGRYMLGSEDGVRRTTAGRLRSVGFEVTHTPTRFNPDHTSVTYPGRWDQVTAAVFVSCFEHDEWYGEEKEEPDE